MPSQRTTLTRSIKAFVLMIFLCHFPIVLVRYRDFNKMGSNYPSFFSHHYDCWKPRTVRIILELWQEGKRTLVKHNDLEDSISWFPLLAFMGTPTLGCGVYFTKFPSVKRDPCISVFQRNFICSPIVVRAHILSSSGHVNTLCNKETMVWAQLFFYVEVWAQLLFSHHFPKVFNLSHNEYMKGHGNTDIYIIWKIIYHTTNTWKAMETHIYVSHKT